MFGSRRGQASPRLSSRTRFWDTWRYGLPLSPCLFSWIILLGHQLTQKHVSWQKPRSACSFGRKLVEPPKLWFKLWLSSNFSRIYLFVFFWAVKGPWNRRLPNGAPGLSVGAAPWRGWCVLCQLFRCRCCWEGQGADAWRKLTQKCAICIGWTRLICWIHKCFEPSYADRIMTSTSRLQGHSLTFLEVEVQSTSYFHSWKCLVRVAQPLSLCWIFTWLTVAFSLVQRKDWRRHTWSHPQAVTLGEWSLLSWKTKPLMEESLGIAGPSCSPGPKR